MSQKEHKMATKPSNIQAQRSKKWIVDALIKLMHHDPFQTLTIKEIYLEAEVSRQTFYRHFKSKEEVLQYYFDELCAQFILQLSTLTDQSLESIFTNYFEFWANYKELVALLFTQVGQSILTDAYIRALQQSLSVLKIEDAELQKSAYIQDFVIGGLFAVKKKWIETGTKETPAQLAGLVTLIIRNVFKEIQEPVDL